MLDQGQTITVSTVDRSYNLTQFDNFRTERTAELSDGRESILRVDHSKMKQGDVHRHLHQMETQVINSETGEEGTRTINVTVTQPKWASKTDAAAEWEGLSDWIDTNLPRTVNFES
jgi:hypothetical protein